MISTLFSSPHLLDLRMRNMPSAAAKSRTPHTSSPWTFGSPKIGHGMPWPWRRKYPDHLKDSELSMVYSRFAGHCIKKIDPNGRIFSLPYPSISIHIHHISLKVAQPGCLAVFFREELFVHRAEVGLPLRGLSSLRQRTCFDKLLCTWE